MGLLEYAWSISFEKDYTKTKMLTSSKTRFPGLLCDGIDLVGIFPEPTRKEDEDGQRTISLMGYSFPDDQLGKKQLISLFRASVFHFSGHVLASDYGDYDEWKRGKDPRLARFVTSLVEDASAQAYISAHHPAALGDVALANALALKRLRRISSLHNPVTQAMAALLVRTSIGEVKRGFAYEKTVEDLMTLLLRFKAKATEASEGQNLELKKEKVEIADKVYPFLEDIGLATEFPFLPHTEELGDCSVFCRSYFVGSDITAEGGYSDCLRFLETAGSHSGNTPVHDSKIVEVEAAQVFDTWARQKERDEKLVSKYGGLLLETNFKSARIPDQDYTEYLRIKARCKSESRRLIDSLLVARDAVDEDPRKDYGVLDLQEVIQIVASKSPRTDVFMLDENLSKSYSWTILLDTSRSMKCNREFALELFIILSEVANEVLLDPHSWGVYAFNDNFYIIKDPKERYGPRIKSRIGGLEFEGLTYIPDALLLAGKIMKARAENMKLITVISDGFPLGYDKMESALSETVRMLEGGSISLMGIGAKSQRMKSFFKSNCPVYDLRDLTKKFSNLYFEANRVAAGA